MPIAPFCLALVAGCRPFADLGRREREDPPPTAERCGSCHVAIYREWRDSPHARSFRSADFLARTDQASVERCLTCHVPAELPASPERPPAFREAHRAEGVTCISCHRLPSGHGEAGTPSGTMAGPLSSSALVQPHPIAEGGEWFHDARFCGRCHEDTLAQWTGSPLATKPSCQECHMPAVERKVTQATGLLSSALVLFEEEGQPLRAHRFSAAAAREEAVKVTGCEFLDLSAAIEGGTLVLELRSLLPHDLPTGGFGSRRVFLRLHLGSETIVLDALSSRMGRALPSGGRVRLEAPLPQSPPIDVVRGILEAIREAGTDPEREPLLLWSRAFEVERPVVAARKARSSAPGGR